jgi:hypothetical protein
VQPRKLLRCVLALVLACLLSIRVHALQINKIK